MTAKKNDASDDEITKLALTAIQAELEKNLAGARGKWDDLKKRPDVPRRWYLLAAKRSHDLTAEIRDNNERKVQEPIDATKQK